MTDEPGRAFFQLPPERYRFEPFGSLTSYLRFLEGIDIGLAPLLTTDYNRGRSDVKFLEYASRGVAGIYADLEPYRDVVIPGETGLLYRTPQEMLEQLDRLHGDAALRQKVRRGAYDYVTTRRIREPRGRAGRVVQIPPLGAPPRAAAGFLGSAPRTVEFGIGRNDPQCGPCNYNRKGRARMVSTLPKEISEDAVREGQSNYLQLPLRETQSTRCARRLRSLSGCLRCGADVRTPRSSQNIPVISWRCRNWGMS